MNRGRRNIHPRKTLNLYAKGEINDLANLAFISATANKKISDRSPSDYFPELEDPDQLSPHLVPLDEHLRVAGSYREFLASRRRLLAAAMTELLTIPVRSGLHSRRHRPPPASSGRSA